MMHTSSHLLQWSTAITVQHCRITHTIPRQTELQYGKGRNPNSEVNWGAYLALACMHDSVCILVYNTELLYQKINENSNSVLSSIINKFMHE